MAGQLFAIKALDNNGVPISGAKISSFTAGTLTPKALYADEAGTVPLANPVVCNAVGIAHFYAKEGVGDYKLWFKDAANTNFIIPEIDNHTPNVDDIFFVIGQNIALVAQSAIDAQAAAEIAQGLAETAATNAAADAATVAADKAIVAADKATVATDKGIVAADKATVAADKAIVAADKATVAADKALTLGYRDEANAAQAASEAARDVTQAYADADVDQPVEGEGIITFNPATVINLGTNVFTIVGNTLVEDFPVTYRNGGGTAPAGLTTNTQYWVVNKTGDDFALSATRGGSPVDITDAGTGTTHQLLPVRSAKHAEYYARLSELSARSDAVDAAASLAAIEEIHLGDFANSSAAWAAPGAATGAIYFDTTVGANYVLGAAAPDADRLAPPLSTQAQAEAGTDNSARMSPLRTSQAIAALQRAIASQAEAEAGADNTKDMTPLRTAQAVAVLAPAETVASQAEAEAGTNNTKMVTPLRLAQGAPAIIFGTKTRTSKYFGILSDGVTDDTAAWNTAIAAFNDGSLQNLDLVAGTSIISNSSALNTILGGSASSTRDFISIVGRGPSSRIVIPTGGTVGQVFQLGESSSSNYARNVRIANLAIELQNTPSTSAFVFNLDLAREVTIEGIQGIGWGAALRGETAGQVTLRDWKVEPGSSAGGADAWFYYENCSTIMMDDVLYSNAGLAGNTAASGKMIHLKPSALGSIDTFFWRKCHMQMYSDATLPGVDGRPYGIYLEKAAGISESLTNVFVDGGVIDHTTIAGIYSTAAATNTANSRAWKFKNVRVTTDSGQGVSLNETAGASGIQSSVEIHDNFIVIQDDSRGIKVAGDNFDHVSVLGNAVLDRNTGTAKTAAIEMACSNFILNNNRIGFDGSLASPTGWATAILLSDADSDYFSIGANNHAPKVANWITEPTYTTPPGYRYIAFPDIIKRVRRIEYYEDFLGDSLVGTTITAVGSDPQCVVGISTGQVGGYLSLTTGDDAAGTMAVNGAQYFLMTNFRVSNGELVMQGRWRPNLTTNVAVFFGFTDQTAGVEFPVTLSGTTYTYNAGDCVGILYDSAATTDNFYCVGSGVANSGEIDSGVAGDTAHNHWMICLSAGGNARFFLNGAQVGSVMTGALTASTLITPTFAAFSRAAASRVAICDYVNITQRR